MAVIWRALMLGCVTAMALCPAAAADDMRRQILEAAARYEELSKTWPFEAGYLHGAPEQVDPMLAARCIAELRPVIDQIQAALQNDVSGWQANPLASSSTGPSVEQSALRSLHKAMHIDIAYRIHVGDTSAIGADLGNLLRLNSLARHEGGVMSSASGLATIVSTTSLIEERALASGALTPGQCAELTKAIDQAVGDDPFGFGSALSAERDEVTNMLASEGGAAFAGLLESRMLAEDEETVAALTGLSEDSMQAATAGYETAMTEFIQLCGDFSDPSAKPRIQKLLDEIESGAYGPVAAAFAPRFNVAGLVYENIAIVRETQATLEAIANGALPASDAANAAFFYRMAIEKLDELPAEAWREIEWHATLDRPSTEPTAFETEAAWSEIFDLLGKASEIERCEFYARHVRIRNGLWPHVQYLDGMQRCAVMLAAATNLARWRGDAARTADLAADLLILIDHLTQEELVEHSDRAVAIMEVAAPSFLAAADFLPPSGDWLLAEALERFEEQDAFEYQSSRATYAALVKQSLRRRPDPKVWFSQAEWVINRAPVPWLDAAGLDREALHAELRNLPSNQADRAAEQLLRLVDPNGQATQDIEIEEFVLPLLAWLIQQPVRRIEEASGTTPVLFSQLNMAIE